MTGYSAPLADMRFVLENIVDLPALSSLAGFEHAEPEMVYGVLEESGRFFSQEFGSLNRIGDTQHSRRNDDGSVTTPEGFVAAYQRYVDAGWAGVPFPAEYGGGGFPWLVAIAMQEMLTAANMASRCARCSRRAPSTCCCTTGPRSSARSTCRRW